MKDLPSPEILASLVSTVTETMFGLSFQIASSKDETPWSDDPPWRMAVLPIAGPRPLRVALASDEDGGIALGGAMFAAEPKDVDPQMVSDSLSELVNIIAGQVKSAMGLDQSLGLPKILEPGAAPGSQEAGWRSATLQSGSTTVRVWVAIAEDRNG